MTLKSNAARSQEVSPVPVECRNALSAYHRIRKGCQKRKRARWRLATGLGSQSDNDLPLNGLVAAIDHSAITDEIRHVLSSGGTSTSTECAARPMGTRADRADNPL